MISDSLQHLYVAPGQRVMAEDHNALVRELEKRQLVAGNGVLTRKTESGIIVSYYGNAASAVQHPWLPSPAQTKDGKPGVRFVRGLVNGIEPKIGEKKISDTASEPLLIPGYDEETGDCLIYVELKLDLQSWAITEAGLAAYKQRPEFKPFTGRKLIAIAQQDGSIVPRTRFDLGFATSQRKPSGLCKQWWWAIA
jgi:hypothetical protein